jgi:hypothetical protein
MRLLIVFIFLTFVVLETNNAAPQSTPIRSSPIGDKSVVQDDADVFDPPSVKKNFKLQFGAIAGNFNENEPANWHYLIGVMKQSELSFERSFQWGLSLISNQSVELKVQMDLTSLFLLDPYWDGMGLGVSQFIWGQDGISNLVNVNQTKFSFYSNLGPHFQAQLYYGLKGLAYSLSFQSWF